MQGMFRIKCKKESTLCPSTSQLRACFISSAGLQRYVAKLWYFSNKLNSLECRICGNSLAVHDPINISFADELAFARSLAA